MKKNTTIKVSKKTLQKLHKLAGELAQEKGKRITLEDAILNILEEHNLEKHKSNQQENEIEKDRKLVISLLEKKVEGAGPEDFMEYDYEDIGGS